MPLNLAKRTNMKKSIKIWIYPLAMIGVLLILTSSCKKEKNNSNLNPVVTTDTVVNIKQTTATGGGNVTYGGGSAVTGRGVCWSKSPNPTVADSHSTDGPGTGAFFSSLIGLTPNTLYYVRAYAVNSSGTSYGTTLTFNNTFYIGASYGGGIIIYIDNTGQHGLIAAASDQSSGAQWGCEGTSIPGTSTALGWGQANTTAIVNICSDAGIAARICNDLVLNNFDDWFLPSKDELNLMYLQKNIIGLAGIDYWSSSQNGAFYGWELYNLNGTLDFVAKQCAYSVRAVRAF
jgi:hypothetical protein